MLSHSQFDPYPSAVRLTVTLRGSPVWGARERVAPCHGTGPIARDAQGEELSRFVGEARAALFWHVENQRNGVGGFLDDCTDGQYDGA